MTERKALFTDRLTLEPTGPDHADGLIAAKERSIEELRPWLAWAGDEDPNSIRAFVHACQQEWDVSEWTFTILLDGEVIGAVGVNRFDPMVSTANLGYWLRTDVAGRGLMTEAAAAVVEFAFGELALHRLELTAAPDNAASVRVAEKLGFKRGGTLRDGSRGSEGWHDVLVFDLLEHDPRPTGA
ncbi:MAG: GNAT family N-acetyltransferase [Actinomycetota bacterium]|nr:GNAT family N-acetyltransferase [Actinomycetota bacterium]